MNRRASFRRKKPSKAKQAKSNLPKNAPLIQVTISHIGGRGDGVGTAEFTHNYETKEHHIFVPDTLAGEDVIVQPTNLSGQGIQAELRELVKSADNRKAPDCAASPACGGCQFQHMEPSSYQTWKKDQLVATLRRAGIEPEVWRDAYFAPSYQRRRARLAFRRRQDDVIIGFRARQSHQIIFPAECTVLAPEILALVTQLRDDIFMSLQSGMTGEVEITLCDNGCDIVIYSDDVISGDVTTSLTQKAAANDEIVRLCVVTKGEEPLLLFATEAPAISWQLSDANPDNRIILHPAPASFLQADRQAETIMAQDIFECLSGCERIVDLFAGSGTLSSHLLFNGNTASTISAFDSGQTALSAYEAIAHRNGKSMQLETTARNLFHAPLTPKELEGFDAAIIDPPRAGASAQMPALAQSQIPHIIMVSCNPHSFAKDAQILLEGGYHCRWARLVDQFALTSHSELIAYFFKDCESD